MHVPIVPILQLTGSNPEFACSRSYRDEIGIGKQGSAAPDPVIFPPRDGCLLNSYDLKRTRRDRLKKIPYRGWGRGGELS